MITIFIKEIIFHKYYHFIFHDNFSTNTQIYTKLEKEAFFKCCLLSFIACKVNKIWWNKFLTTMYIINMLNVTIRDDKNRKKESLAKNKKTSKFIIH